MEGHNPVNIFLIYHTVLYCLFLYVNLLYMVKLQYNVFSYKKYNFWGIGYQWKRLKFELTFSGEGNIEVDEENTGGFYFSDGNNIHKVTSTSASKTRLMYVSALPEKYGQKNSWIWGAGFEWATFTLKTQASGDRTIKMNHLFVDGGYQWNWADKYFNVKYKLQWPSENKNLDYYDAFYFGLGFTM